MKRGAPFLKQMGRSRFTLSPKAVSPTKNFMGGGQGKRRGVATREDDGTTKLAETESSLATAFKTAAEAQDELTQSLTRIARDLLAASPNLQAQGLTPEILAERAGANQETLTKFVEDAAQAGVTIPTALGLVIQQTSQRVGKQFQGVGDTSVGASLASDALALHPATRALNGIIDTANLVGTPSLATFAARAKPRVQGLGELLAAEEQYIRVQREAPGGPAMSQAAQRVRSEIKSLPTDNDTRDSTFAHGTRTLADLLSTAGNTYFLRSPVTAVLGVGTDFMGGEESKSKPYDLMRAATTKQRAFDGPDSLAEAPAGTVTSEAVGDVPAGTTLTPAVIEQLRAQLPPNATVKTYSGSSATAGSVSGNVLRSALAKGLFQSGARAGGVSGGLGRAALGQMALSAGTDIAKANTEEGASQFAEDARQMAIKNRLNRSGMDSVWDGVRSAGSWLGTGGTSPLASLALGSGDDALTLGAEDEAYLARAKAQQDGSFEAIREQTAKALEPIEESFDPATYGEILDRVVDQKILQGAGLMQVSRVVPGPDGNLQAEVVGIAPYNPIHNSPKLTAVQNQLRRAGVPPNDAQFVTEIVQSLPFENDAAREQGASALAQGMTEGRYRKSPEFEKKRKAELAQKNDAKRRVDNRATEAARLAKVDPRTGTSIQQDLNKQQAGLAAWQKAQSIKTDLSGFLRDNKRTHALKDRERIISGMTPESQTIMRSNPDQSPQAVADRSARSFARRMTAPMASDANIIRGELPASIKDNLAGITRRTLPELQPGGNTGPTSVTPDPVIFPHSPGALSEDAYQTAQWSKRLGTPIKPGITPLSATEPALAQARRG